MVFAKQLQATFCVRGKERAANNSELKVLGNWIRLNGWNYDGFFLGAMTGHRSKLDRVQLFLVLLVWVVYMKMKASNMEMRGSSCKVGSVA